MKKATVTLTKIKDGKAAEMHLCQQCAAEASPFQKKLIQTQQNLGQILASLLGQKKVSPEKDETLSEENIPNLTCPTCQYTYAAYKKTMFLGCPSCYKAFEESLLTDLRRIHGTTWHFAEKEASDLNSGNSEVKKKFAADNNLNAGIDVLLDELRDNLQKAVDEERFEDAAKYRDMIKKIKG